MLVLSRKRNEGIHINNDIRIVVVDIRGDKVRLGVDAPTDVAVHRDEVYEAIQREQGADAAKSESLLERIEKDGAKAVPQWLEFMARTYQALDDNDGRSRFMTALNIPHRKLLKATVKWFPQ